MKNDTDENFDLFKCYNATILVYITVESDFRPHWSYISFFSFLLFSQVLHDLGMQGSKNTPKPHLKNRTAKPHISQIPTSQHHKVKEGTHHDIKRPRPRTHSPVPLNKEISLRLMHNLRKSFKPPSFPRCPAHILQRENGLHDLRDRHQRVRRPRTVVEPGTIEVVRAEWSARVDGLWVGELERLVRVREIRREIKEERGGRTLR